MISRDELIQIVAKLCAGGDSEEDTTFELNRLEAQLPCSDISDLIFNNDLIFGEFKSLSPEQIVDEAFRRKAGHAGKTSPV